MYKFCTLLLLGSSLVCHVPSFADDVKIISLESMTAEDFVTVLCETSSSVIKIEKGYRLPIHFNITGPVLSFETTTQPLGTLVIENSFYVKFITSENFSQEGLSEAAETSMEALKEFLITHLEMPLFSIDQLEWKSFEEFFGGELQANASTSDSTQFSLLEFILNLHFKP